MRASNPHPANGDHRDACKRAGAAKHATAWASDPSGTLLAITKRTEHLSSFSVFPSELAIGIIVYSRVLKRAGGPTGPADHN